MKKIIACIAAMLVLSLNCKSGQGAEGDKSMFSGKVTAEVDKLLAGTEVYADPQRVIPVIVNSEQGSGANVENLESYAIIKKGKLLSADQVKRLQAVIFNEKTYDFNLAKKCMFVPYVGFIFEKAGKQAHALFCFSCNEVSFGREVKASNLEDFDAARREMLSLAREVFPGDRNLSALKEGK